MRAAPRRRPRRRRRPSVLPVLLLSGCSMRHGSAAGDAGRRRRRGHSGCPCSGSRQSPYHPSKVGAAPARRGTQEALGVTAVPVGEPVVEAPADAEGASQRCLKCSASLTHSAQELAAPSCTPAAAARPPLPLPLRAGITHAPGLAAATCTRVPHPPLRVRPLMHQKWLLPRRWPLRAMQRRGRRRWRTALAALAPLMHQKWLSPRRWLSLRAMQRRGQRRWCAALAALAAGQRGWRSSALKTWTTARAAQSASTCVLWRL